MKSIILKTTLLSTLIASSNLLANGNESWLYAIGTNVGVSNTSYDQINKSGSITLIDKPKKSFNSLELYTILNPLTDLCKEYNMKPYISYTHSQNSDLKHQYLLVGLNKYYKPSTTDIELYARVLGGYGQIDWKYDPLNDSNKKNVDANSFIGGIQVGVNYPLNEKISLNLNSKYLLHNYETKLKTTNATAIIEHDSTASIGVGLEYSF